MNNLMLMHMNENHANDENLAHIFGQNINNHNNHPNNIIHAMSINAELTADLHQALDDCMENDDDFSFDENRFDFDRYCIKIRDEEWHEHINHSEAFSDEPQKISYKTETLPKEIYFDIDLDPKDFKIMRHIQHNGNIIVVSVNDIDKEQFFSDKEYRKGKAIELQTKVFAKILQNKESCKIDHGAYSKHQKGDKKFSVDNYITPNNGKEILV